MYFIFIASGYCELQRVKDALLSLELDVEAAVDEESIMKDIALIVEQHNGALSLPKLPSVVKASTMAVGTLIQLVLYCTAGQLITEQNRGKSIFKLRNEISKTWENKDFFQVLETSYLCVRPAKNYSGHPRRYNSVYIWLISLILFSAKVWQRPHIPSNGGTEDFQRSSGSTWVPRSVFPKIPSPKADAEIDVVSPQEDWHPPNDVHCDNSS
ncbi:hypothetical protein Trydic_g9743 [Trypoxylus dichotomus]